MDHSTTLWRWTFELASPWYPHVAFRSPVYKGLGAQRGHLRPDGQHVVSRYVALPGRSRVKLGLLFLPEQSDHPSFLTVNIPREFDPSGGVYGGRTEPAISHITLTLGAAGVGGDRWCWPMKAGSEHGGARYGYLRFCSDISLVSPRSVNPRQAGHEPRFLSRQGSGSFCK